MFLDNEKKYEAKENERVYKYLLKAAISRHYMEVEKYNNEHHKLDSCQEELVV